LHYQGGRPFFFVFISNLFVGMKDFLYLCTQIRCKDTIFILYTQEK